jgi:hypothetical protein
MKSITTIEGGHQLFTYHLTAGKQVKDAGAAGIISYALWEFGFWAISVPVVFVGYREVMRHWPDIEYNLALD